MRITTLLAGAALVLLGASTAFAANSKPQQDKMSAAGKRAAAAISHIRAMRQHGPVAARALIQVQKDGDGCVNDPECGEEGEDEAADIPGGQAEVSIAVDESGQHIVVGYNDTRGFDLNPISVSGVLYSNDGGKTFIDGGQLPTPGDGDIDGEKFPQVFGDPE